METVKTRRKWCCNALLAVAAVAALAGCGGQGSLEARIEHRATYDVELTNWVQKEDGTVLADLLVTGPVYSDLESLTVELVQYGIDGEVSGSEWVNLDITEMERGTPLRKLVLLEAVSGPLDGLALDMHSAPTADVLDKIEELAVGP